MRLVIIRHGRTDANEKHLYCGSTDVPLSDKGKEELRDMKKRPGYPDVSDMRVVTSGKTRCTETVKILFGDVPVEADPDFCEMDFGVFEMRSYEQMKEDPQYIEWITGDNESNLAPGGESGALMTARVIRGLERLINDGRDAVLVTHGGVVAAVMAYLFPEENRNRYEWQPQCGGGYDIDTTDRSWKAVPDTE
ncbi:MAG: histidine phosphatase family protein [Oscillospiraceae bacterium]|nr:histidine phosphatase family protein [Oscillospiraceae bacterium]